MACRHALPASIYNGLIDLGFFRGYFQRESNDTPSRYSVRLEFLAPSTFRAGFV